MIGQMSEHSLMVKYSLVGFRTLIMYDVIDRRYVVTENLSCLSISYSYISKRLLRIKLIRIPNVTNTVQIKRE